MGQARKLKESVKAEWRSEKFKQERHFTNEAIEAWIVKYEADDD